EADPGTAERRHETNHGGAGDAAAHVEHGADSARSRATWRNRALHQIGNRQMADAADCHRPCRDAMTVGAKRGWYPMARIIAGIAAIAAVVLLTLAAQAQQFGPAQFAVKDDDGDPITNFGLTAEQMAQVARLPGSVTVGNPKGDVTLYQFYDLN